MPLLRAKYINHEGKSIEFGRGDGLYLNEHDLYNYSWNIQTRGNRIIGVDRKGVKEHNMPLIIVASSQEEAFGFANKLFYLFESDLQANKKGKLVVNGYNLNCFVKSQEYTDWTNYGSNNLKISAKIVYDSLWYKNLEPITFISGDIPINIINITLDDDEASPDAGEAVEEWSGGDKGYYHGYPYDYPTTREEYVFTNKEEVNLSWKAKIIGPATDISFSIGAHEYSTPNLTLSTGEFLEIIAKESMDEKKVIKYYANGNTENCFAYRNKESYLFEPIPTGTNIIRYPQGLNWKLTPIVERSSPKWL